MYEDIRKFLEGKDQSFEDELKVLNESSLSENPQTQLENLKILGKYR